MQMFRRRSKADMQEKAEEESKDIHGGAKQMWRHMQRSKAEEQEEDNNNNNCNSTSL